jgi:hypothetical protein
MTSWHVDVELIDRFVRNEQLDSVTAASIEQHVATCPRCQQSVSDRTSPDVLDRVWSQVVDDVDEAESGRLQRWLVRAGVEPGPVRLLGATAGLRVTVVSAVALVVAVVAWASRAADAGGVYLALAPVVPTGLVAISFALNADPAGECGVATPVFGLPLLLQRAFAVEVLALAVLGAGSIFVPFDGARAFAWLLPATALSTATIAAGSRWPTTQSAAALLAVWFGALTMGEVVGGGLGRPPFADTPVFGVVGQVAALTILVASVAVVFSHRHTLFQEVIR